MRYIALYFLILLAAVLFAIPTAALILLAIAIWLRLVTLAISPPAKGRDRP